MRNESLFLLLLLKNHNIHPNNPTKATPPTIPITIGIVLVAFVDEIPVVAEDSAAGVAVDAADCFAVVDATTDWRPPLTIEEDEIESFDEVETSLCAIGAAELESVAEIMEVEAGGAEVVDKDIMLDVVSDAEEILEVVI